jgi:hypothetical protein
MQASLTGIRQNFTDIRQRWDKAKLKKSVVFWIAIGAIILTIFLGFSRGGWTTGGSAEEMAEKSAQSAVFLSTRWLCKRSGLGYDAWRVSSRQPGCGRVRQSAHAHWPVSAVKGPRCLIVPAQINFD